MKTVPHVMLLSLLFSAASPAAEAAGEGIDQEVILVGNDESVMAFPAPWEPPWLSIPVIFPLLPIFRFLPPLIPPLGDWMPILTDQFPLFLLEKPLPGSPNSDAPP
jgi:hypothetical protein